MNSYEVKLENDKLLEIPEFVKFCIKNQNTHIYLRCVNEGHCLTFTGVYDVLDMFDFQSVNIYTSNALETHDTYIINNRTWQTWLNNFDKFDFDHDYSWSTDKLFGCIYGRPSAPRLGIARHLIQNHLDKSFIKTKFDFTTEDTRKLFDLQRLFSWDENANINPLNDMRYFSTEEYDPSNHNTGNLINHTYKNFLIDLVAEPSCKGTAFYPTEKIVRAILCKHPFITMANKNYLIYMRQLGFKTFEKYWDEDYDGFDGRQRYLKILSLIDSLANKTPREINYMYRDMQQTLDYNFDLLCARKFNRTVTRV
jgi:hypothetical protein